MKKHIINFLICISLALFALTSCDELPVSLPHSHEYGDWQNNTATCTSPGTETRTCKNCAETETRESEALGHDITVNEIIAPTCTENGSGYETCSRCDYKKDVVIETSGHSFDLIGVKPTCTEDGYERLECIICHFVEPNSEKTISSPGHAFVIVIETESTCIKEGVGYNKCERCYETSDSFRLPLSDHDLITEIITEATCTTDGEITNKCLICHTNFGTETLPALGHDFSDWHSNTATCQYVGTKKRDCFRCGFSQTSLSDKLPHNLTQYDAKAPSCAHPGNYAYEACSNCNYTTCVEIPKLEHKFGEWLECTPSCTETVLQERKCEICFGSDYREISPIGHLLTKYSTIAATCTKAGHNAYEECSRCQYSTYEKIDALGHSYTNVVGKRRACSRCGEYKPSEGLVYMAYPEEGYSELYAFGSCTDVDVVVASTYRTLPVTIIRSEAFNRNAKITSVYLPDSVTTLETGAFFCCSLLNDVRLSNNLESIGDSAFHSCKNLTKIDLPISLKNIGYNAFCATALTELYIPKNVESIGYTPCLATETLSAITVDVNNEYYKSVDGVLYTKDGKLLIEYPRNKQDTAFNIPAGVEIIGTEAFDRNAFLETVVFPEGVITIEPLAFHRVMPLKSVILPDSIETIGQSAFMDCIRLENLVMGDNIKKICDAAFKGCAIRELDLKNVEVIENMAFNGCSAIRYVKLPDSLIKLGDSAFSACYGIRSITIGSGLKEIESNMFSGCHKLQNVVIPDNITRIDRYAFAECSKFTSIIIGRNVQEISDSAFEHCYSLGEIYNLSNIDMTLGSEENGMIAYYAFYVYDSLETPSKLYRTDDGFVFYENGNDCRLIGYEKEEKHLILPESCNGKSYVINRGAFVGSYGVDSIIVPDSVTAIGDYAFSGLSVEFIDIGNGVKTMGDRVFAASANLSMVHFGISLESFGDEIFFDAFYNLNILYEGTSEDWDKVVKGTDSQNTRDDCMRFYSETYPGVDNKYWHYKEDGSMEIWHSKNIDFGTEGYTNI